MARQKVQPIDLLQQSVDEFTSNLPEELGEITQASKPRRAKLRSTVGSLLARLQKLYIALDNYAHPTTFDPADPRSAAELIAMKFRQQEPIKLTQLSPFWGAGVYALYYKGDHPAYTAIKNSTRPIYVGKADSQTPYAASPEQQGPKLFRRLMNDHLRSLRAAEASGGGVHPLRIEDFDCRYLVVPNAYTPAAEQNLLFAFAPIWNNKQICDGFGKHGDKAETRTNKRSAWDTLHPGRAWAWTAANVDNARSAEQILQEVQEYLSRDPATISHDDLESDSDDDETSADEGVQGAGSADHIADDEQGKIEGLEG